MRKDFLLTCAIAAFAMQAPVFGEAIIEIRAVRLNDAPIPGTTTLAVSPGDKIEAEFILLTGWGADLPDGIRGAQVIVSGRLGATSGGNGRVLPLGWDAPLDLIGCTIQQDCPIGFLCSAGQCQGASHFPELGASIDENRPDFLLFGEDVLSFIGVTTLNYRLGTSDRVTGQGRIDDRPEVYLGTYIVVVSDFACGTFTFTGITESIAAISELIGPDGLTSVVPTFVPLELDTGACGPIPTDTSGSLNCSLDARYPHPINSGSPVFAENSFVLDFDVSPVGLSASDFAAFTFLPTFFPPVTISSVQVQGTTATVTLNGQFADDKWTCIRHLDTNRSFCRGNLPGDSDQNSVVDLDDIDRLLVDLDPPTLVDGQPYIPLDVVARDIDRSGTFGPLDLLASLNLLGGSGAFSPGYEGASLNLACPSTPAP